MAPPAITPPAVSPDDVAVSLLRPTVKQDGETKVSTLAVKEVKEVKAAAPVAAPEQKKDTKDENLANLRKKMEEAEAARKAKEEELTTLRTEYETFKKAPPVPKEYEEKLTAAEKRAQDLDSLVKVAALAKHPQFIQKYDVPIRGAVEQVHTALIESGLDKGEVAQAIAKWDKGKFDEWEETMAPSARRKFSAGLLEAEKLDTQRTQELQQAEQTWESMQKEEASKGEASKKAYLESLEKDRDAILEEEKDSLSDEAIRKETLDLMNQAAGLQGAKKLAPREVLKHIVRAHVLTKSLAAEKAQREALTAEVATLKAAVEERDNQIKGISNANPNLAPKLTQQNGSVDDVVSRLLKPVVRA